MTSTWLITPHGLPFFHRGDCGAVLTGSRDNFLSNLKRNIQDPNMDATKTLQEAYSQVI